MDQTNSDISTATRAMLAARPLNPATGVAGERMHDDEDADLGFMDGATAQPQPPQDDPNAPDESEDGDGMDEGDNIPGQGGEEQDTEPGSRRPEPRQAA